MSIKAIIEKRDAKLKELEELNEKAKTETRAFTTEEKESYEKKELEIRELNDTIKKISEKRAAEPMVEGENDTKNKSKDGITKEERAFVEYVKNQRADNNMTFGANGVVIPKTIIKKVIDKVIELSPIVERCTRYNAKGELVIPLYDDENGTVEMDYAEEFVDLESKTGKFGAVTLKGYLAGALTKISVSLINNSDIDALAIIVNKMAQATKIFLEIQIINGTTGKIKGCSEISATQTVTTSTSVAFTLDDVIDLQDSIPDAYLDNAFFVCNKKTRSLLRKMKDSEGNYILEKDATARWGWKLFGNDLYTTVAVKEFSPGTPFMFFLDPTGIALKISEQAETTVLKEKFATQHAIGVLTYIEVDADIENKQKVAVLKAAA